MQTSVASLLVAGVLCAFLLSSQVTGKPEVMILDGNDKAVSPGGMIYVLENSTGLQLKCRVTATPADKESLVGVFPSPWRFNGGKLPEDITQYSVIYGSATAYIVTFSADWDRPISKNRSGMYECVVRNETLSVNVSVLEPARIASLNSSRIIAKGAATVLVCCITGDGPINITWYQAERALSRVTVQNSSCLLLSLPNPAANDSAQFTCAAQGLANNVSHSLSLDVLPLPELNVTAELKVTNITSSTVVFQPSLPNDNDNDNAVATPISLLSQSQTDMRSSAIGHFTYKVTCEPPMAAVFANVVSQEFSSNSSVSVSGLHPGLTYSCRYAIRNAVGQSQFSKATVVQTKDKAPVLPAVLSLRGTSPTTVSVILKSLPPALIYGDVRYAVSYKKQICQASSTKPAAAACLRCKHYGLLQGHFVDVNWTVMSTGNLTITLHDLCPGAIYSINVVATNNAGRSRTHAQLAVTEEEKPASPDGVPTLFVGKTGPYSCLWHVVAISILFAALIVLSVLLCCCLYKHRALKMKPLDQPPTNGTFVLKKSVRLTSPENSAPSIYRTRNSSRSSMV